MKLLGSAAVAALSFGLTAPAALALDFGNGFSIVGDVELEYVANEFDGEVFGFADITLGWRSEAGIGLDFSVVSINDFRDNQDETAIWGALVLTTSFGEISVGRPRPLMATFSSAPDLGATRLFTVGEIGLISGSMVDLTAIYQPQVDILGATLKGDTGALSYGVGVHSLRNGGISVEALELTLKYKLDNAEVYGGLETVDFPMESYNKVLIGGRYMQDRWSLGMEVVNITGFGSDSQTFTKVFGDYEVMDRLTLGVQFENWGSSSDNFIGLSGVYTFGIGGFAELGYVSDPSGSSATSASIGFRF